MAKPKGGGQPKDPKPFKQCSVAGCTLEEGHSGPHNAMD